MECEMPGGREEEAKEGTDKAGNIRIGKKKQSDQGGKPSKAVDSWQGMGISAKRNARARRT